MTDGIVLTQLLNERRLNLQHDAHTLICCTECCDIMVLAISLPKPSPVRQLNHMFFFIAIHHSSSTLLPQHSLRSAGVVLSQEKRCSAILYLLKYRPRLVMLSCRTISEPKPGVMQHQGSVKREMGGTNILRMLVCSLKLTGPVLYFDINMPIILGLILIAACQQFGEVLHGHDAISTSKNPLKPFQNAQRSDKCRADG